jgi:hypothetical protein
LKNIDKDVVKSFGEEWNYYKQNKEGYLDNAFLQYFHIFPKELLSKEKAGLINIKFSKTKPFLGGHWLQKMKLHFN